MIILTQLHITLPLGQNILLTLSQKYTYTGNRYYTKHYTGNRYHTKHYTGNRYHTKHYTGNRYHTKHYTGNRYQTKNDCDLKCSGRVAAPDPIMTKIQLFGAFVTPYIY
jgi:hypothetical protein